MIIKLFLLTKQLQDYLNASIVNSFFLTPAKDEEVESLMKEMDTSKSVGPYSIPTNILKLSCSVLSKHLVKLINFSFSEGTFPELLKFTNVISVFKKGDNLDYNNHRPISLISNIGKLIEKIVHKRLYSFLEKNSLFEQQYGFRNKLPTNHALIDITNRIQEACDNGQYACRIYVDFKKTFDTVNHKERISLNTSKTEILLFRPKSKRNITKHLNFRISGQYIP